MVFGITLRESFATGGPASAELTKPSKIPNRITTFDKRKTKTPHVKTARPIQICLLETAQALMFPQTLGQHVLKFNASVLIRAKEGRRNDEDC